MFEWLSLREPLLVYTFLVFNALFESLFPPYPSDAFVLVFAFIAGQGHYNPYLVFTCTVVGSIAGIMIIYTIGKHRGNELIHFFSKSFLGKLFPLRLIERATQKFTKRGDFIIILNRFLPGMRAPICFAAGLVKIETKTVFLYSSISVIIWNLFLVIVGFSVGASWQEASDFLKNYNVIVVCILIVMLVIFTLLYFIQRKR
jgi:membrane protein DedA with SNARE-associated domain